MNDAMESYSDKVNPTYVLKLLRPNGTRFGTKVGVTFTTARRNQRIVWDVVPSSLELHQGTLILVPYPEETPDRPDAA
ncbi:MAG: hypothetical protein CL610_18840 [Anaerolineaceae bacterium]|nr:hypothetical protein [Anaerolineaceae bacterium]